MAAINFPTATANGQEFEGPNGVLYTYIGTPPAGYWSGNTQDGLSGLDDRFLRKDQNDTSSGNITLNNASPQIAFSETDTATYSRVLLSAGKLYIQSGASGSGASQSSGDIVFSGHAGANVGDFKVQYGGSQRDIWHAGNDGSGSGLDADLLDGQQGSYYLDYNNLTNKPSIAGYQDLGYTAAASQGTITITDGTNAVIPAATTSNAGLFTGAEKTKLNNIASGATNTPVPAITSNGSTPSLNTGISAAEVRSLIGAGESSFSGSYNDLSNKPTIPTNNNQLTNGAGYTTFDGNYNSLTNKPNIPTNNNQLTNGAGYITSSTANSSYLPINNSATYNGNVAGRYLSFRCVDGQTADSSSAYLFPLEIKQNTLNKDAAITFHISSDFGTYFGLDGTTNDLFVGGWSNGANKYKIFHEGNTTIPTQTSDLTNDSGFIDDRQVPSRGNKSQNYTVTSADVGGFIPVTNAGITVTFPNLTAGDCITLFNRSGANIFIDPPSNGYRLQGETSSTTSNRTLAAGELVTILYVGSSEIFIAGIS